MPLRTPSGHSAVSSMVLHNTYEGEPALQRQLARLAVASEYVCPVLRHLGRHSLPRSWHVGLQHTMSRRMSMANVCDTDKSTYIVHEILRPPPFTRATAQPSRAALTVFSYNQPVRSTGPSPSPHAPSHTHIDFARSTRMASAAAKSRSLRRVVYNCDILVG